MSGWGEFHPTGVTTLEHHDQNWKEPKGCAPRAKPPPLPDYDERSWRDPGKIEGYPWRWLNRLLGGTDV